MKKIFKRKTIEKSEKDILFNEKEPSKRKMRKRINTLENEVETLKQNMKEKLYTDFVSKLSKIQDFERIKSENKKLRKKVKELKALLNN